MDPRYNNKDFGSAMAELDSLYADECMYNVICNGKVVGTVSACDYNEAMDKADSMFGDCGPIRIESISECSGNCGDFAFESASLANAFGDLFEADMPAADNGKKPVFRIQHDNGRWVSPCNNIGSYEQAAKFDTEEDAIDFVSEHGKYPGWEDHYSIIKEALDPVDGGGYQSK